MLDALSKSFFHALASSTTLRRAASRYGLSRPGSFGRRFIAGETIDEAIDAARALEARGFTYTLDLLGEGVGTLTEAEQATRRYLAVIDRVIQAGIGRNLSLKLTQLGLDLDRAACIDNLRRILDAGEPAGFFVRIDMENSPYTEATLQVLETVWAVGHRQVGTVIQSCLRRSDADIERLNRLGARVRLVKGAYKEPPEMAYQRRAEVDAAFARQMRKLLEGGVYPAIATHDPALIAETKAYARELGLTPDRFEFQMLYGVRRDLQAELLREGYNVRVYIPFGREWFPYFMRRLGERPANVLFVVRSLLREA